MIAVLTSVSAVQQHQRSSVALQQSTQTLQGLCCRQVDLIQQDPVALLHCLSQRSLQRDGQRDGQEGQTEVRLYRNAAQVIILDMKCFAVLPSSDC